MVEVVATDAFRDWYLALPDGDIDAVTIAVERLQQMGVALGCPHSSEIRGSSIALRELRVAAGHSPLRVFYAFDPRRDAVLLVGGNKTRGKRFIEVTVPRAEAVWEQYLKETGG